MDSHAAMTESTLVFERRFAAPPDRVWRALTEPDEVRAWLAKTELELRPGGSIVLTFENSPSVMRGTVTEVVEGRVLEYTWHEGRDTESVVRFAIEPDGDGSRLTLTHTFEQIVDLSGFGAGWHHHLELLESRVAGSGREWDDARYTELKRHYESMQAA